MSVLFFFSESGRASKNQNNELKKVFNFDICFYSIWINNLVGALRLQIIIKTNYLDLNLDLAPAKCLDPFGFGFIWNYNAAINQYTVRRT